MNLNWCTRLATLFLACLLECRSQGCIDIDNVIRLTSTAVEVDWTIAFAPEAGEQYRVAYGLGGNPLTQSSVLVNAASGDPLEMYRLYIDGLDPTAEYCFQVQVVGAVPPDCSETQCISAPVGTLPTEVPTGFTAEPTGPTQVRFSWSADSLVILSCHTTENLIVLRTVFSVATTNSIQSELTGVQFTAYTEYICDISVLPSAGVVGPSSTMMFRTLQDAPDSPPTAVAVGAESPYEVRVTWSPPTTPNGIITQYRLSATLNGSPLPSIIVPRDDLTRVIDGLTPFGIVTVMISASTIVGEGPSSPTVTLRTLEAPPSEVTNFLVSVLSDTSLVIFWGPPERPNGILTRYAYTVSDNPVTPGPERTIAANDSQTHYAVRVDSLSPFVEYVVVAYAVNSADDGAPQSSKVYTKESVPNIPVITAATRRSSDSMRVDWTAENTGGFITRYTVEYEPSYTSTVDCQRQSVDVPLPEAVSRDSNTITINGLQSGYSYTVSITAYNSIGASPRSAPATVESFISGDSGYNDDTRSSVVQLRLSGVENCSTWIEENTSVDLVSAIAVRLSIICPTCGYTSVEWLMDSILQCTGREDQVLFRAVLSTAMCSGPTLSCSEHLEFWASLQDPFLRFGEQVLLVDSTCPLYTNSLTSDDCMDPSTSVEATDPTCIPSTVSRGGIIAASFLGGALAGFASSLILIIATCAYFLRKPKRGRTTKSSENVESDNPTARYGGPSQEPDIGYELSPSRGYAGATSSNSISKQSHQSNKKRKHQPKSPGQSTASTSVPHYDGLTASSSGHYHAKGHFIDHSPASWMWSEVPEDPEAENQSASHYEDDDSPYDLPSSNSLPHSKKGKAKKKPGSRDTGSEAESERVSKRSKELRSTTTTTVQKEQRVREASNPSEQRMPGKKMPLRPPGQGGKPRPQPVSKSRRVQDGDKVRGSPSVVQPKAKYKATGNITFQHNVVYDKATSTGSAASSLSSSRANV